MTRIRKLIALVAALVAAFAMSGCLVISGLNTTQQDVIGQVRIVLEACFSQGSPEPCADAGNVGFPADNVGGTGQQALIGFRIPDAATAPDSFSTTSGESLTFTRSQEYTAKLQELAPAPAGQRWVGYAATSAVNVIDGNDQKFTVAPEFTLQQGADGSPFSGPFRYRPVVGARNVTDTLPIGRALDCGTSLFADNVPDLGGDTICVDSPTESDTATNLERTTRDLGVLASNANGTAGGNANVPFVLKYAGTSTSAANFALGATTNIPGATATPSQGSLLPATDSTNPVGVDVKIPAGTAAGVYDVILTAALPNGQTRTNTAKLSVAPAPAAPPAKDSKRPRAGASLLRGQDIESLLATGRLRLNVTMDEAGTDALSLTTSSGNLARTVTIAKATARFAAAGTKRVTLRLNRKARSRKAKARMRELRRLRLSLKSTATDIAGNVTRGTKRLTLRP